MRCASTVRFIGEQQNPVTEMKFSCKRVVTRCSDRNHVERLLRGVKGSVDVVSSDTEHCDEAFLVLGLDARDHLHVLLYP